MPRTWEVKERPKQYIVFDEDGRLISGDLDGSLFEGEQALVEYLEELGEDYPNDIENYKVFEVTPVCFEVSPAKEVVVTLKLDC